MGVARQIRDDLSPDQLRGLARQERNGRAAARMYAIAHALEGMSRAQAARLAGMERQALRDAVVRYNAEGLCGLQDRPKGHAPQRLTEAEQATLMAVIFKGPDPDKDGVCAWTRADLCRWMEQHLGKSMPPSSLSRVLHRMGLSRQKARPVHPRSDPKAQEQFAKRGSGIP
jgi:transposase